MKKYKNIQGTVYGPQRQKYLLSGPYIKNFLAI